MSVKIIGFESLDEVVQRVCGMDRHCQGLYNLAYANSRLAKIPTALHPPSANSM